MEDSSGGEQVHIVGDNDNQSYVRDLSRSLAGQQITLWFVDENHEDHDRLDQLHAGDPGPVPVDDDADEEPELLSARLAANDIKPPAPADDLAGL